MKINTNLTPGELRVVAKGLQKAADMQQTGEYTPENPAEKLLMDMIEVVFTKYYNKLTAEIGEIINE